MQKLRSWIVAVILAFVGFGIQMSGIENQFLSKLFFVAAFLLSVWIIWTSDYVRTRWRKGQPWTIRGARLPRFKLYEAACLLHDLDPVWPLTNQKAKEEYQFLVKAAKEFRLRVVIPDGGVRTIGDEKGQQTFHLAWKEADDGPEACRDIEVDRKALREYLESEARPVPAFLNERFDSDAAKNLDFFS